MAKSGHFEVAIFFRGIGHFLVHKIRGIGSWILKSARGNDHFKIEIEIWLIGYFDPKNCNLKI